MTKAKSDAEIGRLANDLNRDERARSVLGEVLEEQSTGSLRVSIASLRRL